MKFSHIKVLIWDFDGTLYKPDPLLWRDVRESEYRVIADHTKWAREKVLTEFEKLYNITFKSATQVVAKLANISVLQAAQEMEEYYDRTKYLSRDEKLIELFQKLTNFSHYLLVNGIQMKIKKALKKLGLSHNVFKEIVTSETVGDNKPSPKGFEYILKKTRLPAGEHLMIGDRIDVDLAPAKKLGMKTYLVTWGESSTVYNLANLVG